LPLPPFCGILLFNGQSGWILAHCLPLILVIILSLTFFKILLSINVIVLFYISEVTNEARDFILELERRNEIHTATVAHVFSPVSITLPVK
jgi:hypothetical protein